MVLRGINEYSSQEDEPSDSVVSDKEKSENAYPYEGELLMIRKTLSNQPNESQES